MQRISRIFLGGEGGQPLGYQQPSGYNAGGRVVRPWAEHREDSSLGVMELEREARARP